MADICDRHGLFKSLVLLMIDVVVKSLDDCSTAESFTEFGKMGEKLEMEFSIAK